MHARRKIVEIYTNIYNILRIKILIKFTIRYHLIEFFNPSVPLIQGVTGESI